MCSPTVYFHSVFAPTNSSFTALDQALLSKVRGVGTCLFCPSGTNLNSNDEYIRLQLLEPEWILHLRDVLLYHVAPGNVSSSGLSDGQIVTMANEETVAIAISDGNVFVNGAQVVVADVFADNGVAHIINAVLTPSFISTTIVDIATAATSTLANLVVLAGLDDELSAPGAAFTVSWILGHV